MRHATELQARIGIANEKYSKEIPFIFLFDKKKKCGMTRVSGHGLSFADGDCE